MRFLILLISILFSLNSYSQIKVRECDILYQKRIVRSLPLSCIENQKLFGQENQLVNILLEAFETGRLQGYYNADQKDSLSWSEYLSKVQYKSEEDSLMLVNTNSLNVIELDEDLIVDKNRSDIVFIPKSITVLIPANVNPRGILEPLVSFSYDDCIRIFKSDPNACAKNPLKNGRNINFSEIFIMHLYASSIVKMDSINDLYYDQKGEDPMQAFLLGKKEEEELITFLYKLFNPE